MRQTYLLLTLLSLCAMGCIKKEPDTMYRPSERLSSIFTDADDYSYLVYRNVQDTLITDTLRLEKFEQEQVEAETDRKREAYLYERTRAQYMGWTLMNMVSYGLEPGPDEDLLKMHIAGGNGDGFAIADLRFDSVGNEKAGRARFIADTTLAGKSYKDLLEITLFYTSSNLAGGGYDHREYWTAAEGLVLYDIYNPATLQFEQYQLWKAVE